MGLIASKKSNVVIPPLESGTYMAVCIGVVDLGEQLNAAFKKYQDTVSLTFEFVDETVERGNGPEPRWISKEYTKTLGDKSNLFRDLKAWRGGLSEEDLNGFDIASLLGKGCMAAVEANESKDGKIRNRITGLMALPKGVPVPKAQSESFLFDMDNPSTYATLEKLPQFIRDRIEKSTTWARKNAENEEMKMDDDDEADKQKIPPNIDPETGEYIKNTSEEAPF